MTWNFSVPWNLSMYLYCCLSGILHYSKNVLCLLKTWDGRNPAGGQRTALSVAMSKEERHHWLLVSYPSFNVHLFLSSRWSSLRGGRCWGVKENTKDLSTAICKRQFLGRKEAMTCKHCRNKWKYFAEGNYECKYQLVTTWKAFKLKSW